MSSDNPLPIGSAILVLKLEYNNLQEAPIEGFLVHLPDESNLFEWELAIFGPPGTLYEGGYFKARMSFPRDYPYSPPMIVFSNKIWHPNVFTSGSLRIPVLQPQSKDSANDPEACKKWSPAQNVQTILLSVISVLNEPDTSHAANSEATRMYELWRETKGDYKQYEQMVKKYVEDSKYLAQKEGVAVPTTVDEYRKLGYPRTEKKKSDEIIDTMDYYINDDDDDDDDDDAEVNEDYDEEESESEGDTETDSEDESEDDYSDDEKDKDSDSDVDARRTDKMREAIRD